MEKWSWHEGETVMLGGYPVTVAKARAGHFVAFVGSGTLEDASDTQRKAREYLENLDNRSRKDDTFR